MPANSERTIFLSALELESGESRSQYLARACAGNPELRASVEALLDAHQLPSNPLDRPVAVAGIGDTQLTPNPGAIESAGTMIGPYRLMEQIGEGGFGLVFAAQQQQPVRRQVALKVIKPGMDTREVIARFEAERQALAMMEHPNIASVLDAGMTQSGRPYFVMELVRGIPITEFCQRQQLSLHDRLNLFVSVCNAVQHAHQKGVIHRDLKPSNVLVTKHDDRPVAKVIDFGVAKALGQSLTEKTIYTRFAAMIGTPLYMSPEQAELSGLAADTRTDIYSLGVLLYELLTGDTPFGRQRFQTAGLDEVRRIIREEDPPKPSVRVHTNAEAQSTVIEWSGQSIAQHSISLQGDLDWIVMKALEKNRERRYESASELAKDVQRYLASEPVTARPPSRWYLLQKFAARHRGALLAVSAVAATLLVATAVSLWAASVAVSERNDKHAALQDAIRLRQQADEARNEIAEFASRMKAANLLVTNGRAHVDGQRWAAAYEDFNAAIETQPNYYNAWIERAALEVKLGLWDQAARDYAQAIELGVPEDSPANWGIPQLFLYTGNATSYREYCQAMLQQAEQQGKQPSLALIRSCVMSTDPVGDPQQLATQTMDAMSRLVDRPPPPDGRRPLFGLPIPGRQPDAQHPGPPRPGDRPPEARERWQPRGASYFTAGMALLRAERFQDAVDHLEQAVEDRRWRGRSIVYPALALAHHRNGDADRARKAFIQSEQNLDSWSAAMLASSVGEMPIPWFDWIEASLLHREASQLLTGFAPADDPRLREIQERAKQVIDGSSQN